QDGRNRSTAEAADARTQRNGQGVLGWDDAAVRKRSLTGSTSNTYSAPLDSHSAQWCHSNGFTKRLMVSYRLAIRESSSPSAAPSRRRDDSRPCARTCETQPGHG